MGNKMKKVLMGCSLALAGVSIAAFVNGISKVGVEAEVSLTMPSEISATYQLGSSFSVPAAKISLNGEEYDTDFVIVYPDGSVYEDVENALNVLGTYTIIYSAEINGEIYREEKSFQTVQVLYQVGEGSLVEYVDKLTMVPSSEVGGIHISLKEGDEFIYNEPINLFETKEFIKFYPYNNNTIESASENNFDSKKIVVRLTDCYNEDIYVEYVVDFYGGIGENAYYRAGSSTQKMAGLAPETKAAVAPRREIFIDGIRYLSFYEDDYGTQTGIKNFQDIGFTFSYDLNTDEIFVKDNKQRLVNDLSNPDIYSERNLFEGFTTGEVYLSIRGSEYYGDEMNLDIERIGVRSGEGFLAENITDTVAPIIKIDYGKAVNSGIKIAQGEAFRLLKANAYDIYLKGDVRTRVYYNYNGGKDSQQVGILNGSFIPNRLGEYTVVYEAEDFAGNITQELMTLQCVKTENDKSVQFNISEFKNVAAGEILHLDYFLDGLNGGVWLNAYAVHEGGEKVVVDDASTLLLTRSGTWKLCFEYGDAFSSYTYEYEFTCLPSDKIVYLDDFILPEYFIHNMSYSIEEIFAYTFEGVEPTLNEVTLYVSEDEKEYRETTFDRYVVEAEKTVQFKVEYKGESLKSEKIPVVDVGFGAERLNIENYFVGGDFEKAAESNLINFTSNVKNGENEMMFVNTVSLDAFAVDFQIPSEASDFGGVEFTFVDYYNRSNQITLFYRNQNGIISFGCGEETTVINSAIVGVWHNVVYDKQKNAFIDKSGTESTFKNTFISDKVIVKISLTGICGDAAVQIKRFNQQPITNARKDTTDPLILVDDYSGYYRFNQTVKILAASAMDVLSPVMDSSLRITVKAPNGEIVTALDDTKLDNVVADKDYEITLSELGNYSVLYTVKDQSGRDSEKSMTLLVQENSIPQLSLNDGYNENTVVYASRGATLKAVSYQVADDDEKVKVFVVVYAPDMTFKIVDVAEEFEVSQSGEYTVCYFAYDSVGNYTSTYYTIRVS